MSVASIYEKMLQDPKNRKRSHIKQPTPSSAEMAKLGVKDSNVIPEEKKIIEDSNYLSPEEEAQFSDIDRRMEKRWNGKNTDTPIFDNALMKKVQKLEEEIKNMQELMTEIMKTHMKLLERM